jgi:hypothetical protein
MRESSFLFFDGPGALTFAGWQRRVDAKRRVVGSKRAGPVNSFGAQTTRLKASATWKKEEMG